MVQQAPAFIRTARQEQRPSGGWINNFDIADRIEKAEKGLPEMLEGAATPILTALGGILTLAGCAGHDLLSHRLHVLDLRRP